LIGADGHPEVSLDCVFGIAPQRLDDDVLLDPLEEDLYLPSVAVLGHSLTDVDLPYFEKIARESPNAKWYVCVVNDKEKKAKFDAISKIVKIKKVGFITYDELTIKNDIV